MSATSLGKQRLSQVIPPNFKNRVSFYSSKEMPPNLKNVIKKKKTQTARKRMVNNKLTC